ncbi:MAG: sigma-70 family RNA polymerase sigma factor [Verrucomicrobia bacterium]|nr:sigma-70 family RNA polymerase sigma factor [Verrucomicrobiota bacterium]
MSRTGDAAGIPRVNRIAAMEDWKLLDAYAREGSEAAFSTLVERHLGLVHAAARRQVRDDALAADVAQAVFLLLARKAGSLGRRGVLSAWLFQTTRFVASRALRSEIRRQRREQEAFAMQDLHASDPHWNRLAPELDEALARLAAADRSALLLRFAEGRNHREVGDALGLSEEAAKKRVARALDRLRDLLVRQGVTVSVVTLAGLLADRLIAAPPPGLAATIIGGLAEAPATAGAAAMLAREVGVAWRRTRLQVAGALLGTAALLGLLVITPRERRTPSTAPSPAVESGADPQAPLHVAGEPERLSGTEVFRLQVVAADTGQPLAGARVPLNFVSDGEWLAPDDLTTDASGECRIPLPRGALMRLDAGAHHPGYENRFVTWRADWQHPRPDAHTLRLARGKAVGGTVVDELGRPKAGVGVWLNYQLSDTSWREPDEDRERVGFLRRLFVGTTDAEGRWICDTVSPERGHFAFEFEHPDYVPETSLSVNRDNDTAAGREAWAAVNARRALTRLQPGAVAYGRVVDATGAPVEKARIRQSWHGDGAITDAQGQFSVGRLPKGEVLFVATAEQYAPKRFSVTAGGGPVRVTLDPGATLRVRMVSTHGEPIEGATLALQDGFGDGSLGWDGRTDADGRVEWQSAPPGGRFTFTAYAPGHQYLRNLPLSVGDAEHTLTLWPHLVVTGSVVDAVSGAAIPRFKAIPGTGREFPNFERSELFYGTNGQYRLKFAEGGEPVIRIEAPGYETVVGYPKPADNGGARCDFELRREDPDGGVRGVVLNPDGSPAAGAEVALCTLEKSATLGLGRFLRWTEGIHTNTDSAGRFAFPVVRLPHTVAAVSSNGFGRVGIGSNSPVTLQLKPFGMIEGVVSREGRAQPGKAVALSDASTVVQAGCISPDPRTFHRVTDSAGRFRIEGVPDGEYVLHLNPGIGIPFTDDTQVTVVAGETVSAVVGEPDPSGRVVTGRIRSSEPLPVDDWRLVVASSSLSKTLPFSKPPSGLSEEEGRQWRFVWTQSDEGRDQLRAWRRYTLEFDSNGHFAARGVRPGEYSLSIRALPEGHARQLFFGEGAAPWQGFARRTVTIPEPDPANPEVPFDLGDIELKIQRPR